MNATTGFDLVDIGCMPTVATTSIDVTTGAPEPFFNRGQKSSFIT